MSAGRPSLVLMIACAPLLSAFSLTDTVAPPLPGRLFHSVAQRTELDRIRQQGAQKPHSPVRKVLSLDGMVWSGGARPLIWINGQLVEDSKLLTPVGRNALRISLANGQRIELHVGDSIEIEAQAGLP